MKLSMKKAFCEEPTERQNIDRHMRVLEHAADAQVRDPVGGVGEAFDRLRLEAASARRLMPVERWIEPTAICASNADRHAVRRRARP